MEGKIMDRVSRMFWCEEEEPTPSARYSNACLFELLQVRTWSASEKTGRIMLGGAYLPLKKSNQSLALMSSLGGSSVKGVKVVRSVQSFVY